MNEEILHEKRDSIEISRNAKGEVAWKIKRYYDADTQEYRSVVDEIEVIHEALQERFL